MYNVLHATWFKEVFTNNIIFNIFILDVVLVEVTIPSKYLNSVIYLSINFIYIQQPIKSNKKMIHFCNLLGHLKAYVQQITANLCPSMFRKSALDISCRLFYVQ